jgi:hypothetical protein
MTPTEIEPATFWLEAQCHNQLRYGERNAWTGSKFRSK